jgi:predicted DNA-binding WGR domain protein
MTTTILHHTTDGRSAHWQIKIEDNFTTVHHGVIDKTLTTKGQKIHKSNEAAIKFMNKNIAAKKKKGYTVPFQTSLPDSSDSENDDVLDEGGQADAEASVPASPASPIKNKKDNKKRSLESVDAEVDDDDENINNVDAEVDDDAADDDDDDDEVAQPKKKKSKKSKPQKPPLTKKQLARKKAADAFEYTGGRSGMELQNEDRTRYYKCKVNKSKFEVTLKYGALSKDGEEGKAQVTTKQCDNVKEAMKYCSTKMKKQLKNGIVLL